MNWKRLLVLLLMALVSAGCGQFAARYLSGDQVAAPEDFSFVGEMSPCYLELQEGAKALRVNCFHIDGTLHIHSSRWAKLPRFSGENWTETVRREPAVRIQIDELIYPLKASPIDDELLRTKILHDRGYWHAWSGITVVRFYPSETSADGKWAVAALGPQNVSKRMTLDQPFSGIRR